MIRKALKILPWAGGTLACLILVLIVHIYLVTRPKAPDAHTRIMARMDIKQSLSQEDGEQVKTWLYSQPGVDHVLVNVSSRIAVFTYSPLIADAGDIISRCSQSLHYTTTRYVPSEADLQKGCPAMAQSLTGKIYHLFISKK
ncbi:hypothetical protein [Chitinophaga sancti]|uniref:Uncharacterized protein n=1 Tax=Chitinophaga sancti TaxID=1004 RepID=A0A1K1NK16_9BACT|nr:hypothetical protein [Chitinophaga sancti]WQD63221.1 hypothetical protein U0033_02355 [Chitinophaga sancti]WQG91153.1 hypothetical protein SR876_06560 [Chitinophaga sancti]SFW34766.1 hypothetical protein SAMN05661012_01312 [Chitinophaga sancti]